jgi:hypothetical protein
MLQISSNYVAKSDVAMIKKYARFVLDKFVKKSVQARANIKIRIVDEHDLDDSIDKEDLRKYRAWCYYDGIINEKRSFTVILNIKQIKRSKNQLTRLSNLLIDLGHELVHIKQYLNNEIFDYVSGEIRYKGSYFDSSYHENEELYYDSPWEIEAYGRELGLYKMFCNKLWEGGKL